jgi:hypothetical protein
VMMILCHLIQKQPPKPPKNSVLHKLLNQRKSHAIQNTRTQNCKEKTVAIQNLHWELLQSLNRLCGDGGMSMRGWSCGGFFIGGGP